MEVLFVVSGSRKFSCDDKKIICDRIRASPLVQNSAYGGYFVSTDEEVESLCLRGGAEYLYNYIRMKLPNLFTTLRSIVVVIILSLLLLFVGLPLVYGLSEHNDFSISIIAVISSDILFLLWLSSIPAGLYFSLANKKAPRELIVTYLFFTGLFLLIIFMFSSGGPLFKMLHHTEFECSFYSGYGKDKCYSNIAYSEKDLSICYDKVIREAQTRECVFWIRFSTGTIQAEQRVATTTTTTSPTIVPPAITPLPTPLVDTYLFHAEHTYRDNGFGFSIEIPSSWTKYAVREERGENSYNIYFALPQLKSRGMNKYIDPEPEYSARLLRVGWIQIMTVNYFDAHKHDCGYRSQCFFPKEITRDKNYVYGLGMPRPNFFSEYCPPEATAQDHYICGRGGNSFPENIEKTFKLTR